MSIVFLGRKLIFIYIENSNNYFSTHNFSANSKIHSYTSNLLLYPKFHSTFQSWPYSRMLIRISESSNTYSECSIPVQVQDYLGYLEKSYSKSKQTLEADILLTLHYYYIEEKNQTNCCVKFTNQYLESLITLKWLLKTFNQNICFM